MARVLRPRAPFKRRRRPRRLFFDRLGVTFMSCHHIDFVAFDFPRKHHLRLLRHDPFTQLRRHVVDTVFIQIQFPSDLPIRQVQPQEIQAQQPDSQRLMMARKNGVGEVIEIASTATAVIPLPAGLSLIPAPLGDLRRVTTRTSDPGGPTQFSHRFKALLIVDQRQERQFHLWLLASNSTRISRGSLPRG